MRSIVLRRFEYAWQAYIAKGRLDAEGVQAAVTNEHISTANWTMVYAVGLVELRVPASEADRADEILNRHESGAYEEAPEASNRRSLALTCGSCGSTQRERLRNLWTKEFWTYVLSSVLFGIFWPSSCWIERCGGCGSKATARN